MSQFYVNSQTTRNDTIHIKKCLVSNKNLNNKYDWGNGRILMVILINSSLQL